MDNPQAVFTVLLVFFSITSAAEYLVGRWVDRRRWEQTYRGVTGPLGQFDLDSFEAFVRSQTRTKTAPGHEAPSTDEGTTDRDGGVAAP